MARCRPRARRVSSTRGLGVGLEHPGRVAGAELPEDHLVLAGMDVRLRQHPQRPLALPGDVVVAALRLLQVLHAVDPVVEPPLADSGVSAYPWSASTVSAETQRVAWASVP